MERSEFIPGMRVRTKEPHLVTGYHPGARRGARAIWTGRVTHLSSERVGAVWVKWDAPFVASYIWSNPVRPEMLEREDARGLVLD